MDLVTTNKANYLPEQAQMPSQHSQKLIQCLVSLESEEKKSEAKMELLSMTGELMPSGKPSFLSVVKFPKVVDLVSQYGKKTMLKVLFLMIKDFCSSVNVVRNMSEDQMIEVSVMLIDEADNFRLEDYVMFFAMAKKGALGKIRDRVDMQTITEFLDEYWLRRKNAADVVVDAEVKHFESLGNSLRSVDSINPLDARLMSAGDGLSGAIGDLKTRFGEWRDEEAK